MCSLLWFSKEGAEEVDVLPHHDGQPMERASQQHRFESRGASAVHYVFTWGDRKIALMSARSLTLLKAVLSGSSKTSEPMAVDGGKF